jgi:serralysin
MSWFSDTFRSAGHWVADRVEDIGDWLGNAADSAWSWISDNVSGVPLKFFSYMATVFPSYSFGGVGYFTPNHADKDVNALMSGSKWSKSTITYSLPDSRSDYESANPSASGYQRLSGQNEDAVHAIMGSVAAYVNTGISYAGRDSADVQVAGFNPGSVIARSHGYYPGVPVYGGDTWLDTKSYSDFRKGTFGYFLTMHELGHSLGLKHPHDSADRLPRMSTLRDSTEYTVMSYNDTDDRPQTFMQYDIAALQAMYGADFTTNSGNTYYTWGTNGQMFINGQGQGETHKSRIFLTIWDGGGVDTYDMSNFSEGALIDLTPSGYSRFSRSHLADKTKYTKVNGNVYNAFQYNGDSRSLIENAIGGAGDDRIIGNQASNVLEGRVGKDELEGKGGADTLLGGAGDDTLDGGSGSDVLRGDEGYDFASYASASSGVVVSLSAAWQNTGDASGDTYISIEALSGSRYGDSLTGNAENNNLYGHGGNDWLSGLDGRDYLMGGDGDDSLVGGAGGDWLIGGAGYDLAAYNTAVTANLLESWRNTGDAAGDEYESIEALHGSNYADHLTGNHGDNYLYGAGGHDELFGLGGNDHLLAGGGDDTLDGGTGADTLDGGEGFDLVNYASASGGVQASLISPWGNTGGAAGDMYVSIEGLIGSGFNDRLTGSDAANQLSGEGGNDELYGNGGVDTLLGGDGADGLHGGAGADVLDGGAGFDFACYDYAAFGVTANLSESWRNTGEAYGDTYVSIEAIGGSAYADTLTGNEGYNELFGFGGNDQLFGLGGGDWLVGGEGHDLLVGGAGHDALTGGNGSDIFRFDSALGAGNVDTVNDFTVGSDVLQLSRSVFTAFANQGSVDSWQFTIGAGASAASHRLIYNSSTGAMFYDADGVDGAAQVQFATLGKGLALSASSFALIWL